MQILASRCFCVRIGNMKKYTLLITLLVILCLALLSGCVESTVQQNGEEDENGLKIVATIFPPYDFVREIASTCLESGQVDLRMLIPPGAEIHFYEPTPADIIAIAECDIFICIGGESDSWVDDVLASLDTSHMQIVRLIDMVDLIEEEIVEGMEVHTHTHADGTICTYDHSGEEESHVHEDESDYVQAAHTEYDEHVWTSPQNVMVIVQQLCDILCTADAAHATIYEENTAAYLEELAKLDAAFLDTVAQAKHHLLIFGDRFPFLYFARTYGLDYYAAFPGCASQTEPSAATIAFLIDKVKEMDIGLVFQNELSAGNEARLIAEATGAQVRTFYACHNLSRDDFEAGENYLSLMWKNVSSLKEALN